MNKIIRIARLELSVLFYSPIAWLVLIIFTFQSGMVFTELLHIFQRNLFMGRKVTDLTGHIFEGDGAGLFPQVAKNLYLYIPLLTMGLMSRETSSGSIKLLLSSPVRNREIVLGKFAGMMAYGTILMGVLCVFVFTADAAIFSMDGGWVLSGLLGLYLLLCAYSAIGLFFSCLTSYQVIAAISTLAVLAMLNYIGQVWQRVDFVRDLTYWLSLSGRVNPFIDGLISSRDVIYFLLVTGLFLGLSILKLRSARESGSPGRKAGRYVCLAAAVLVLVYLSSRSSLTGYYDMTATKARTLTLNSQEVVKKMQGPLTITTYVNLLDMYAAYFGFPERRNEDKARFEEYQRFLPDITMNYVYYYDSAPSKTIYKRNPGLNDILLAKKMAVSYGLDFNKFLAPAKMRSILNLGPEKYTFVRQVEYGGKRTFLRIYADNFIFPSEQEITAAFKRLITPAPVVGFLAGNEERNLFKRGDKEYMGGTVQKNNRYALINQGFDVVELGADQDIPDSITALVVADPLSALDTAVLGRVLRYIGKGGNLLIAGEPGRQNLLGPLYRSLGIGVMKGQLVEQSKDEVPELVLAGLTEWAGQIDKELKPLLADSLTTSMPGVAGLTYSDSGQYVVRPLLMSDSQTTWNRVGPADSLSGKLVYHPEEGDRRGSFPVMLTLTRKLPGKEQRIIVAGDADFMSNEELGRGGNANPYLLAGIFKWFSNGAFPIDVSRPATKDDHLRVTRKEVSLLKVLFLGVLPLLIGVGGGIVLTRRSRK